tara:strand:- start:1024 stop:1866 length:843 start_codon:yes stop_codon:yes gene_type:complete
MITHCISTYNNLPYLKLAVESVRKYSYWKDAPFIIHAENCSDGTDEWLRAMADEYKLTYYVDKNDNPKGIGGGMNFCAEKVQTEFINFLHSDFYVGIDWDLELMRVFEKYGDTKKLWVNSFRFEPNMFNSPDRVGTLLTHPDEFGGYYYNFDSDKFIEHAKFFAENNNVYIPKGEGVSGLVKKTLWDRIGGNDPIFAPTSWDDHDLFLRMIQDGVEFVMPSRSVVYHFGARGSHRLEENDGKTSKRQSEAEKRNQRKFFEKWGGMPIFDEYGMICGVNNG